MTLFLVRHHHSAERCPAQDPEMGAMILNHLSRPNVRRCGVRIRGEAVVRDEHTLYFIADADDEDSLRELGPFRRWAASTSTRPPRARAPSRAAVAPRRHR